MIECVRGGVGLELRILSRVGACERCRGEVITSCLGLPMKLLLRRYVAGCLFGVLLAGVFTATSAMGGKYSDVISINLTDGSASGSVSGSVVGMNGAVVNWFNDIPSASTHALAAGLTANGVAVPALSLNMFDGGWNALGTFNTGSQPVNTLGRSGISEGEMINNWGQVRNDVQFVSGLPPGFDAANSELWGYVALHSQTATFQWLQYTYNKDGYYYMQPFPNGNGAGEKVSVGAYQLWKLSPQAPSIHVLGTNSLSITNSAPASVAEGTDFGVIIASSSAVTNTFVITNSGTIALYLTNSEIVVLTGDTNCFAVSTNGMTIDVAADAFTTFSLAFSSTSLGVWTGLVTIANSDTNNDPYCFSVRGTVVPA